LPCGTIIAVGLRFVATSPTFTLRRRALPTDHRGMLRWTHHDERREGTGAQVARALDEDCSVVVEPVAVTSHGGGAVQAAVHGRQPRASATAGVIRQRGHSVCGAAGARAAIVAAATSRPHPVEHQLARILEPSG